LQEVLTSGLGYNFIPVRIRKNAVENHSSQKAIGKMGKNWRGVKKENRQSSGAGQPMMKMQPITAHLKNNRSDYSPLPILFPGKNPTGDITGDHPDKYLNGNQSYGSSQHNFLFCIKIFEHIALLRLRLQQPHYLNAYDNKKFN